MLKKEMVIQKKRECSTSFSLLPPRLANSPLQLLDIYSAVLMKSKQRSYRFPETTFFLFLLPYPFFSSFLIQYPVFFCLLFSNRIMKLFKALGKAKGKKSERINLLVSMRKAKIFLKQNRYRIHS